MVRAQEGRLAHPDQVRNLTVLVFVVSAAVGVFIAAWDFIFTEVVKIITPAA